MEAQAYQPITEGEAIRSIQALEERFNLLRHRVDGWCLWPLLRFDIVMEMVRLPFAPRSKFSRLQQLLIALRDVPAFLRLQPCRFLVKSYSSARTLEEGGRMKDVFFDDLLEGAGGVFRLEGVNSKGMYLRRTPPKNPSSMTSLPIELLAGMLSLLPGITPDFSAASEAISSAVRHNLPRTTFTKKRILRKARFFYWGKKLYRRLLQRVKPEKVLVADPGEHLLAAAAKELGIPVVEFQHGLVSRDYNCFYSWTGYAKQYKRSMPIPDAICLFGNHWKDELLATDFWNEELRATGHILLDSFRKSRPGPDGQTCRIVLSSQGLEREKLITLLSDFALRAESQKDFKYRLFIKMHPVYDLDKSEFQKSLAGFEAISILEAGEKPSIFELLAGADLHWSISSTCHYDAIGMGVPTVILGLQTWEDVLPLYRGGQALLARDAADLFEITRSWKTYRINEETREYFYRSGALENARKELDLQ